MYEQILRYFGIGFEAEKANDHSVYTMTNPEIDVSGIKELIYSLNDHYDPNNVHNFLTYLLLNDEIVSYDGKHKLHVGDVLKHLDAYWEHWFIQNGKSSEFIFIDSATGTGVR